jgi:hypothetical protein
MANIVTVAVLVRVEIDLDRAEHDVVQQIKDRADDALQYLRGVTVLPRRAWERDIVERHPPPPPPPEYQNPNR